MTEYVARSEQNMLWQPTVLTVVARLSRARGGLPAARPQDLGIFDAGPAGAAGAVVALLEGPIGAIERARSEGTVRNAPGLGSLALGLARSDACRRRRQQCGHC